MLSKSKPTPEITITGAIDADKMPTSCVIGVSAKLHYFAAHFAKE